MDDEEFEDEYDLDAERPMTVFDLVIAVWCLLGVVSEGFSAFFNHVAALLVAHRNYKTGQRDFANDVRAELEQVPTTEELP